MIFSIERLCYGNRIALIEVKGIDRESYFFKCEGNVGVSSFRQSSEMTHEEIIHFLHGTISCNKISPITKSRFEYEMRKNISNIF